MRKHILLPAAALAGGLAGFGLRLWQWSGGYDPGSQLFLRGHPAMYGLPLLAAALALIFLLALQGGQGLRDFPFFHPAVDCMSLKAAASLLLMGAGVLGFLNGLEVLSMWRVDPDSCMAAYPASLLLCSLICLVAGPCLLLLARGFYRGDMPAAAPFLSLAAPLAGLIWLFTIHLSHSTDPILTNYGWGMAASALLMLAHYYQAALFQGRLRARRAVFCALMGTVCGLIYLADRPGPFQAALTAALLLSALADARALLRAIFGPPWPKRLLQTSEDSGEECGAQGLDSEEQD